MTKKYYFPAIVLFLGSDISFAFELGGNLLPPSQQKISLRYSGSIQPSASADGGLNDVGVLQTQLSASVPVYRGEENGFALTTRYSWLNFYPDNVQVMDLYDLQFGASFTHILGEKRLGSVTASFGSASDKPFEDSTVCTLSVTGFYTFPSSEAGSWLILINYSNNRPILNNIPIPGFAYTYTPSKNFRGTFGIPFASIYWQFFERWSLTLFTLAPWVAKVQVAYSVLGPMQILVGFDFSQMTYLQYGRLNSKDRLFYDEKKAFVGLKSPLSQIFFAEVETGYSFGRRVFSAESYTLSPASSAQLGASWYGKLGLSASW